MEDFKSRIVREQELQPKFIRGLEWLKSIKIKKKADGTDYARKQMSCAEARKERYGGTWYIDKPENVDLLYSTKSYDLSSWGFRIDTDSPTTLEEDIQDAIRRTEDRIERGKQNIRHWNILDGYWQKYVAICESYAEIMESARQNIQAEIEKENPEAGQVSFRKGHCCDITEYWLEDFAKNHNWRQERK